MHFFGCLFAFFLGILFIGLALVGNLIDVILSILGFKKRVGRTSGFGGYNSQRSSFDNQRSQAGSQESQQGGQRDDQQTAGRQTHKIFEKNDSEYVDFEEV